MKLYSTQTGELIKADPNQIPDLISSGQATFKKGDLIPVVDSSGVASTVPAEEFSRALSEGYSLETADLQEKRRLQEEYGDSPLRAGAEGVARGLSLGLSDVALSALGADEEGLAARKELNPIASTGGEVAGAIAPIFLSGGAGALAKGASLAPSALAARAGTAVTGATAKALGTEAATTLAGKIVAGAIPMAAGSAVEGALYSGGGLLSEAVLGDPKAVAEKAISQIGMGALMGGGIGALVGAAAAPFMKAGRQIVSEIDAVPDAALSPNLNKAQQGAFADALTKSSKEAPLVKEAADAFGVPVFPESVSKSGAVKQASTILDNSISPTAIARNNLKAEAAEKVSNQVVDLLGGRLEATENQVTDVLKAGLKSEFDKAYEPSQRLYKIVKENLPFVEVTQPQIRSLIPNIRKLDSFKFSGSIGRKIGEQIIENLPNVKTADDAIALAKSIKRDFLPPASSREMRMVVGEFTDKLEDMAKSATVRAGEKLAKESGSKAVVEEVLTVLDAIPAADKSYAVFRKKLNTFSKQLGRKSISGKAGFEDLLEEIKPQKLLDKMFDKTDPRFLTFMKEEFPEQFDELIKFKKSQILQTAEKAGSLNKAFKEIDSLVPEVKELVFGKEGIKKLQLAETYLKNLSYSRNPVFGNPSGTAFVRSMGEAFESPQASLRAWGRDLAIDKLITATSAKGMDGALVGSLKYLEGAAQNTSKAISNSVKYFLSALGPSSVYIGTKLMKPETEEKREDKKKSFEKKAKDITAAAMNPEILVDKVAQALEPIADYAPQVANAAAERAANGAMYLYETMPKNQTQEIGMFAQKKWAPSEFEMSKWLKRAQIVDDPLHILKELRAGKVESAQVDALKNVYPEIYKELQTNFVDELSKNKSDIPYNKKVQIGILFGTPVDYSLQPQFIQQMQVSHAQALNAETQQPGGAVSASRADKLNFAQNTKTETQKVVTRT